MILVTGTTGLAGSAVIREFARQHVPVRALVRNRAKAAIFDGLASVEVVEGDMLQPQTLRAAFEGVDRALMISTAGVQMMDTQCTFIEAAKAAGIQGTVILHAIIGMDGTPLSLRVMNGDIDPELTRSAVEAVSKWRYRPTLLNGEPIEVDTTIMVNFKLLS